MWNGMCTIEMIENLKIENSTKIWVCAISPYHRRIAQMINTNYVKCNSNPNLNPYPTTNPKPNH